MARTESFKLRVLAKKFQNPDMSYNDLSFEFKVAKSSISKWANDPELVLKAKGITDSNNPESIEASILKVAKENEDRSTAIKDMLYTTIKNIYGTLSKMNVNEKIKFANVLKDVSREDLFKSTKDGKAKSVMQTLIDKYGIDKNIGQA